MNKYEELEKEYFRLFKVMRQDKRIIQADKKVKNALKELKALHKIVEDELGISRIEKEMYDLLGVWEKRK